MEREPPPSPLLGLPMAWAQSTDVSGEGEVVSNYNPISALIACIRIRREVEILLERAGELEKGARERFYAAAMAGGTTAHQCDIAWAALKQKAEAEANDQQTTKGPK